MNTTAVPRAIGRLLILPVLVALFALATGWLAAGAAWAEPGVNVDELIIEPTTPEPPVPPQQPEPQVPEGPGDVKNPDQPRPGLAIKVVPDCERTPGIRYEIIPLNQPGPLSDYHALWGPAGGGAVNAHPGQAGFISSGEGEFTVSGHAVRDDKKYETEPVNVVVKCDKPTDEPDPDPDPDKPRPGKPNFTG